MIVAGEVPSFTIDCQPTYQLTIVTYIQWQKKKKRKFSELTYHNKILEYITKNLANLAVSTYPSL